MEAIYKFLEFAQLTNEQTQHPSQPTTTLKHLMEEMQVKLLIAKTIRTHQEFLKGVDYDQIPLALRLINKGLRVSAERDLQFTEASLREQGTTTTHVVYSNIDRIDGFLRTLLQTVADQAEHTFMKSNESSEDVTHAGCNLIKLIFEAIPYQSHTLS